jgi:hypothetical protein
LRSKDMTPRETFRTKATSGRIWWGVTLRARYGSSGYVT